MRQALLARGAALACALPLVLVSCGEGGSAAGEPAEPGTRLDVMFWPAGRDAGEQRTVTLTCDPAGGTHPHPARACEALAGDEAALDPVPSEAVCTQIFGGPQEARVFGVHRGREVDATFSRNNGCEIDRWDRLAPLVEV